MKDEQHDRWLTFLVQVSVVFVCGVAACLWAYRATQTKSWAHPVAGAIFCISTALFCVGGCIIAIRDPWGKLPWDK